MILTDIKYQYFSDDFNKSQGYINHNHQCNNEVTLTVVCEPHELSILQNFLRYSIDIPLYEVSSPKKVTPSITIPPSPVPDRWHSRTIENESQAFGQYDFEEAKTEYK